MPRSLLYFLPKPKRIPNPAATSDQAVRLALYMLSVTDMPPEAFKIYISQTASISTMRCVRGIFCCAA